MPFRLMREHGAGHHIARRQVAPGHEAGAGLVDQHGAFAAHGLGDQGQRRPVGIQGGRVELHEFQMLQLRAGRGGEDQAAADRRGRVGAVAEQPANAAGGEQHAVGRQGDGAGGGLREHADDFAVTAQKFAGSGGRIRSRRWRGRLGSGRA